VEINPTITINLRDLRRPIQISHVMCKHEIASYGYAFVTNEGIIKYGESGDNSATWGERIYRQAAHLPGWPLAARSSSGADMRLIALDFEKKYGRELHKDTVWIEIYQAQHKNHGLDIERDLLARCVQACGRVPLGNRDKQSAVLQKAAENSKQLERFFEFRDE
jgi:hypothetical protein